MVKFKWITIINCRWGRKTGLLLSSPLVLASWIIHAATRSISYLFIARVLQGMSIGFFFTAGPAYLAEISQPSLRGELCGHLQTMWFVGVLYSFCTGPFMSYQMYIYASAVPAVLFLATFIFMPESPYSLLMRSDVKGAQRSLSWLRGDADVSTELKAMSDEIEAEQNEIKSGWKDLFMASSVRKPLLIITVFGIVKYLGGTATIQNFITQTLSKSGGGIPADYVSISMGIVLLLATIFAALVSDMLGRRFLVMWSTALVAISSVILAFFYFFDRETMYDTSGMEWISYIGFVLYCIGLNIGLGPLQTVLQAEYFPSNLRSAAGIYCNLIRNIFLFASIKQYQLFDDYLGVYTNFLFYAVVSFIGLIILYKYMDETAKKSLAEIRK